MTYTGVSRRAGARGYALQRARRGNRFSTGHRARGLTDMEVVVGYHLAHFALFYCDAVTPGVPHVACVADAVPQLVQLGSVCEFLIAESVREWCSPCRNLANAARGVVVIVLRSYRRCIDGQCCNNGDMHRV